jgi:hypothetical protein
MSRFSSALSAFVAILSLTAIHHPAQAADSGKLSFNRDIRPILSENCFACHGFDAKKRQGDLRLDVLEAATASRDGSVAIKPGSPDQSEVWKRIISKDPDEMMPPPTSHKKLTDEQKQILRRWIAEGAPYQKHWSFEPLVKPTDEKVNDTAWVRNPIDRFVLARLEREGLKPMPEADRATLIRRVSFALTGLPPSATDVERFLNDKSPDAYEQMVERYLSSDRYGEEMARHWLDVARYADTHGLHLDNERHMYAYRDWVIAAFNRNVPFDQFTIWQLAGDQLPNPTPEQLVATGFNRCNVTTSEGGSIAEEFVYRYAVDRASTTLETWLGLTGGCAVCHDHKYDPLTTKDFYSIYAFFNSSADPAMDGNISRTAPFEKLPQEDERKALAAAQKREEAASKELEQFAKQSQYTDPVSAKEPSEAQSIREVLFDDVMPLGATEKNTTRNAPDWLADPEFGAPSGRRVLRQKSSYFYEDILQLTLTAPQVPENATFEIHLRIDPQYVSKVVAVTIGGAKQRLVWGDADLLTARSSGPTTLHRGPVPKPGEWHRLSFSADDCGLKPGQRITGITVQQIGGVAYWDAPVVIGKQEPKLDPRESFELWWKGIGAKAPDDVPNDLKTIITVGPQKAKDQKPELIDSLRQFYLAYIARPRHDEHVAKRQAWEVARAERSIADDAIDGTMIFRDLPKPRDAFVMMRGQYDKPGDKVEPATPAFLPPLKKPAGGGRATRLDLARWLVSPEHPLTARVQANRLWQQFFGIGLVKTSFDFGSQGEMPSHAELLDWLAVDFRDHGWDMKRFVRQVVSSATFRQQSRVTSELRTDDPENRLLARGARFRLDAEQIRDNALFVSGLINLEMGGRGVKLYQPPNIWEPVGYGDSNTRYYLQDHGAALYRRSIYAFLKRTAPPPFMSNFDGPNREQFCTRRERSNTPLQALQLMNDVQHFEAARALAERTIREGGGDADSRVRFLYRTVLSRQPTERELKLVRQAFETQLKLYQADPKSAEQAIRVGESKPQGVAPPVETAAWTLTANLILNLDETVTRQ